MVAVVESGWKDVQIEMEEDGIEQKDKIYDIYREGNAQRLTGPRARRIGSSFSCSPRSMAARKATLESEFSLVLGLRLPNVSGIVSGTGSKGVAGSLPLPLPLTLDPASSLASPLPLSLTLSLSSSFSLPLSFFSFLP